MNAMPLLIIALALFALAYRYYHAFIAARVVVLNDLIPTPAHKFYDRQNYYPMNKWILFGHHFAAIAGAGPLVGPVLAAQFGFFPGFAWIVLGSVIAGAVHDFVIFVASIRHEGKSLAEIASKEIGKVAGYTASFAVFIIMIVALAGLGIVVVNALAESSWGTFTIFCTIPIAFFMGWWMFKFRPGKTVEATVIGVILLTLAVIFGEKIPGSFLEQYFLLSKETLTILLAVYGFFASVLPVWLLLSPRDYLSSIMKIGVIFLLAVGVIVVAPDMHMPAFTAFVHGGGPIINGPLFPYLFITIACGAISGWHSVVSSGTSPKMLDKESHIKMIGFGAMLTEGIVSILALIAATSMFPLDYFQINVPVDKFTEILPQLKAMGFTQSNFEMLSKEVGEQLAGRTGGAVSLAVGMAQIFSAIPGLRSLMSYWYHFAIMFEALFILTVIDAGTRIARFILQEILGKFHPKLGQTNWMPGSIVTSAIIVFIWGYFIYSGSVSTIWPMFGVANQLLATIALTVGTTFIINRGKFKYAWVTIIPLVFVGSVTIYAGFYNIFLLYVPMLSQAGKFVPGLLNLILTFAILFSVFVVLFNSIVKWVKTIKTKNYIPDEAVPVTEGNEKI
jgi:carbon starvation protein